MPNQRLNALLNAVEEMVNHSLYSNGNFAVPDMFIWKVITTFRDYENAATKSTSMAGDTERCGDGSLSNLG